nr:Thioredoxin superfamily protein isoform 1 [Ipomoea batatas]GMD81805.1 Thioredoxin superfamily protein isoform 1 [Ipomoea batatas]
MVVAVGGAVRAGFLGQAARNTLVSFNRRRKWSPVVSYCYSSPSSSSRKLILYSKPGCCLCDGLKEKLAAAFSISGSEYVVDLEVRDITTNPEWEKAYQFEIPVLARLCPDGTEEVIPRLSPRLGVELVRKKITAALGE